ncbi:MAG: gluconeogenesis factor YvcK family protein [Chloroflexota bacterium]
MKQRQKSFLTRIKFLARRFSAWLKPGLGIKRWLFLIFLGTTMLAVGFAFVLLDFYRAAPDNWVSTVLAFISLQSLPRALRALIFGSLGLAFVGVGIYQINRTLLLPYLKPGKPVVESLAQYRQLDRGPRIVVIGGGHGQSTLLRGLKKYTHNLTAIVTVADDGGSSGKIRESAGILPPGDIRNCLAALSNDEDLITQLYQYRFSTSEKGLNGHSFGNLLIQALTEMTGSFERAVAEAGRVLSINGRVLPSTLNDVRLIADKNLPYLEKEVRVKGESQIPEVRGQVRRLWLDPLNPPAFPATIRALLQAEMIIIGPGSLYTSILPNLLVPDIVSAIRASEAFKIYVSNITTQPGETDNYTCGDHISAIEDHVGDGLFELVVSNNNTDRRLPPNHDWVLASLDLENHYPVYRADFTSSEHPYRHDTDKLGRVLIDLFMERTGPLAI